MPPSAPPSPSPTGPLALRAPAATPATPDVTVVVVNYNVREFLEQALRSVVKASAGLGVETFVVDNDSVDSSVEMVRRHFPHVHVIANQTNVGFGRANNQAIRRAAGRYILVLNPDTLLREDTLRTLVAFMDAHPDAGAVGCQILNPDGSFAPESRRAYPTPSVALYRMLGLSRAFPQSRTFGRYNFSYLPPDEPCEVDALSGSCMLVRREALLRSRSAAEALRATPSGDGGALPTPPLTPEAEAAGDGAGLFDEAFFMYGEDLDWCYRIQQAGWAIHYTPATQIVHYKGESTRKGELRYVRLFYGAMLQFSEKHFAGEHSRAVAGLIRAGIFARAAVSAAGNLGARLKVPLLDAVLVAAFALLAGLVWAARAGIPSLPASYVWGFAPLCGVTVMFGVAAAHGYARHHRSPHALRPALSGVGIGFLIVCSVLFLVPGLAPGRVALVLTFLAAAVALPAWRVSANRSRYGLRRALLVGPSTEAQRLHALLARRMDPPLRLEGYVGEPSWASSGVPCLGPERHLRDLVRLQRIDDVVFAAEGLSNTTILGMMQTLRDLPVQFKIFSEGADRIIGKARVHDLSSPLREAEVLVAPVRSPAVRRSLELALALTLLLASPLLLVWRMRKGRGRFPGAAAVLQGLPDVLAGRRALIGFDPDGPHPPPAWGLRPGVVSILDTMPERPTDIVETHRAYWFYARNQSAALDADILLRAFLRR